MKKDRKIFKYIFIFFILTIVYNIICEDYSFSGDKMEKRLDLISMHNLDLEDVDKITIETVKYSDMPYKFMVIEEKDKINKIVAGLKNTTERDVILMAEDYKISFWKNNKKILVLGLRIRFDYPDLSYFRYRKDDVYDYTFSAEYYNFLVSLLSLRKEVNRGTTIKK